MSTISKEGYWNKYIRHAGGTGYQSMYMSSGALVRAPRGGELVILQKSTLNNTNLVYNEC
jgi:hypothetical protein